MILIAIKCYESTKRLSQKGERAIDDDRRCFDDRLMSIDRR